MQINFIIIFKEKEKLKITLDSLKSNYPESSYTLISSDIEGSENGHKILKGKNLMSCINIGMFNGWKEWNCILTPQTTWVKDYLVKRYASRIQGYKDIFYPVMNQQINFTDNNLNGIMIHKKAFNEIGGFPENVSFEESKILWANNALDRKCQFKGVIMKV